jgi:hypothetical protein
MKKESITICVDNKTTQDELKEIRQLCKSDPQYKDHRINIIISGQNDFKQNLYNFIKARK